MKETVEKNDDNSKSMGFWSWVRASFLTGVLTVAPILLTLYIIRVLVGLLNNTASSLLPAKYTLANYLPFDIPGFELLLGFILLFMIGILVRNYIGEKLLSWLENFVEGIPGVGTLYSTIKQVLDTVATSKSNSFREVVLVQYPLKGTWAIGFVTGETKGQVQRMTNDEMLNVFVPTTPNPTSGFLLFVPRSEARPLHMTVDQGLKMVISAGIVAPSTKEGVAALQEAQQQQDAEPLVVEPIEDADEMTEKIKNQQQND